MRDGVTMLWRRACFAAGLGLLALALLVPSALAGNAYVANSVDDSVSVFSTETNQVIGPPIAVGDEPEAIAITPDGKTAYVVNKEAMSVSAIDTATNRVVSTIPVGSRPTAIATTPDGKAVYVVNFESGNVTVIDAVNNRVVSTIPVGSRPGAVAVSPDGKTAYVAAGNAEGVVKTIDTATNQVVGAPIPVGSSPTAIAITPDGRTAYVANGSVAGSVSVIDTATNEVVGTPIIVGRAPTALAIPPDGKSVYVVNSQTGDITVIDTTTNQVGLPITIGPNPTAIAVTPDGKAAYVTRGGSAVSVIDTANNLVTGAPITVGAEPAAVAVTPDQDPRPSFTVTRARPGVPVLFSAVASSDPSPKSIAGYSWAFGDGQVAAGTSPSESHAYGAPGTYTATLSAGVKDGCPTASLFTGQTAYCRATAPATLEVRVEYPGVRVGCPKKAKPHACAIRVQAVTKRRKGKAKSALASARVKAGATKVVSLKPKGAFRVPMSTAQKVLVRETLKIGAGKRVRYRVLKIVQ